MLHKDPRGRASSHACYGDVNGSVICAWRGGLRDSGDAAAKAVVVGGCAGEGARVAAAR